MMKWRAFDLLDEEVGSFELGTIITLQEIDRFFLYVLPLFLAMSNRNNGTIQLISIDFNEFCFEFISVISDAIRLALVSSAQFQRHFQLGLVESSSVILMILLVH